MVAMSLFGPILLVSESPAIDLMAPLEAAGAFPIVELSWAEAAAAVGEINPAAVVIADSEPPDPAHAEALGRCIENSEPLIPLFARVTGSAKPPMPQALPITPDVSPDRLVSRLRSALRVRSLHAAVLRRAQALQAPAENPIRLPPSDPLDDATVLIVGRGRTYPELTVAVGERVGIVGAFSIENAARYLNARDIDGIVIGDGFSALVVDAFLTALAEDVRFRELPVAVIDRSDALGREDLPNLVCGTDLAQIVEHTLPLVRFHALECRLNRVLKSLDAAGLLDPQTGLLLRDAFWRDLIRAVDEAQDGTMELSLARFSFEQTLDRRTCLDAARLLGRLVRIVDFACQEDDGSIVAAFTDTDLRAAHVVARRIASVLKHTMLAPDRDGSKIHPTITLATLKSSDTVQTLVSRVMGTRAAAAE